MLGRKLANLQKQNLLARAQSRGFSTTVPQDCIDHLKKLGITNPNIVYNPT